MLGLSRPSMASEALGLLPGENAGAFSGKAKDGLRGPLAVILVCAALGLLSFALGLLPGGNAGTFLTAMEGGHAENAG